MDRELGQRGEVTFSKSQNQKEAEQGFKSKTLESQLLAALLHEAKLPLWD